MYHEINFLRTCKYEENWFFLFIDSFQLFKCLSLHNFHFLWLLQITIAQIVIHSITQSLWSFQMFRYAPKGVNICVKMIFNARAECSNWQLKIILTYLCDMTSYQPGNLGGPLFFMNAIKYFVHTAFSFFVTLLYITKLATAYRQHETGIPHHFIWAESHRVTRFFFG